RLDVIDVAEQLLELCGKRRIPGNLREAGDPGQAEVLADGVEVGEPQVATTLQVQRDQVEPTGARRAEQEGAHVVDDLVVELLRLLRGNATEERLYAVGHHERWGRGEERVAQRERTLGDRLAVGAEALDGRAEQRVADAVGGGREHRADARVHPRV